MPPGGDICTAEELFLNDKLGREKDRNAYGCLAAFPDMCRAKDDAKICDVVGILRGIST